MKTPFAFGYYPGKVQAAANITLHSLVACLLPGFRSVALKQKVHILNDVPAGFCVTTDETLLSTLIRKLFSSIIDRSNNSCITVTAKRYRNIILIHLKDTNKFNWTPDSTWEQLNPLAEKLGGCIVANPADRASVTFSFRCLSAAA